MRAFLTLLAALMLGSSPGAASLAAAQDVQAMSGPRSLQSVNFPARFIRHRGQLGELSEIVLPGDRADSTFIVVPGLNGATGSVSFESVNFRGHFLRHQDFRLRLAPNDGGDLFRNDASFLPRAGLADGRAVSFEATNFPGHFIRHSSFQLWLHPSDGTDLFRLDATFLITAPNEPPAPVFACYWLQPGPEGRWQSMPQFSTLVQCYEQDSCSGGSGLSGGGCYKWAPAPDAPGVQW